MAPRAKRDTTGVDELGIRRFIHEGDEVPPDLTDVPAEDLEDDESESKAKAPPKMAKKRQGSC